MATEGDSRVEIDMAYINTVHTGYYYPPIDDNLQKMASIYYKNMTYIKVMMHP